MLKMVGNDNSLKCVYLGVSLCVSMVCIRSFTRQPKQAEKAVMGALSDSIFCCVLALYVLPLVVLSFSLSLRQTCTHLHWPVVCGNACNEAKDGKQRSDFV